MTIYVLITSDNVISGIYSTQDKLISDLSTTFSGTPIKNVEIWEVDKGFSSYLNVSKKTTITINN